MRLDEGDAPLRGSSGGTFKPDGRARRGEGAPNGAKVG
jgi:hypothetical protein